MTLTLILFLFWILNKGVPEKKDPGYIIAPTEEEILEIELGINNHLTL